MPPKKEVKPLPDNIYENIAMIRKNLFQVKVTGPICRKGIQELLSSILDIPWDWIERKYS